MHRRTQVIKLPSFIDSIDCCPVGKHIAVAFCGKIRIYDLGSLQQYGTDMVGHFDQISSVKYSADGRFIISGSLDTTIKIWVAQTQIQFGKNLIGHDHGVNAVAFSYNSLYIVSGSEDATIRIWNCRTQQQDGRKIIGHLYGVKCLQYAQGDRYIISGGADKSVRVWNSITRQQIRKFSGHLEMVHSIQYSIVSQLIITSSSDKTIRICNQRLGKLIRTTGLGHTNCIKIVSISPNSQFLVSGGGVDRTVRLYNLVIGQQIGEYFLKFISSVRALQFSYDGKSIISASYDETLKINSVEKFISHQQL